SARSAACCSRCAIGRARNGWRSTPRSQDTCSCRAERTFGPESRSEPLVRAGRRPGAGPSSLSFPFPAPALSGTGRVGYRRPRIEPAVRPADRPHPHHTTVPPDSCRGRVGPSVAAIPSFDLRDAESEISPWTGATEMAVKDLTLKQAREKL